ncbi:MAG: hypothetical protein H6622_13995 [Halobacteriovoraceae bacterium]|nr:hypothetical protein [Halobacteriovoraceae bacterium]
MFKIVGKDSDGDTVIHNLIHHKEKVIDSNSTLHITTLKKLAQYIDINKLNNNGMSPPSLALYRGHIEDFKQLVLIEGFDFNKSSSIFTTPLGIGLKLFTDGKIEDLFLIRELIDKTDSGIIDQLKLNGLYADAIKEVESKTKTFKTVLRILARICQKMMIKREN